MAVNQYKWIPDVWATPTFKLPHKIFKTWSSIGWIRGSLDKSHQGLVTVPFWEYWTSPKKVAIIDHIPNGWVMWKMGTWLMTHGHVRTHRPAPAPQGGTSPDPPRRGSAAHPPGLGGRAAVWHGAGTSAPRRGSLGPREVTWKSFPTTMGI